MGFLLDELTLSISSHFHMFPGEHTTPGEDHCLGVPSAPVSETLRLSLGRCSFCFLKDALFCFLLPFEDQAAGKPEHSAILLLKFFFFFPYWVFIAV